MYDGTVYVKCEHKMNDFVSSKSISYGRFVYDSTTCFTSRVMEMSTSRNSMVIESVKIKIIFRWKMLF